MKTITVGTKPSFIGSKADRKNGRIAGLFFITATVTAIAGLKLYDPLLATPDYLTTAFRFSDQIALGAIAEMVLAGANIGTGLMLYPYLRRYNESAGLGYVIFRMLEVVFIVMGIVSILTLLHLSQEFSISNKQNAGNLKAIAEALKSMHNWTFVLGPHFSLGINTFIYSYIFYRSGLVPKGLSALGMIGALLVITVAILEIFGLMHQPSAAVLIMCLPIAVYEMILAARLITKGFSVHWVDH